MRLASRKAMAVFKGIAAVDQHSGGREPVRVRGRAAKGPHVWTHL